MARVMVLGGVLPFIHPSLFPSHPSFILPVPNLSHPSSHKWPFLPLWSVQYPIREFVVLISFLFSHSGLVFSGFFRPFSHPIPPHCPFLHFSFSPFPSSHLLRRHCPLQGHPGPACAFFILNEWRPETSENTN